MKMKNLKGIFKSRKAMGGCAALALAVIIGTTAFLQSGQIPELPVYTDPVMEVSIQEEETPLAAAPKVTSKTNKKTSSKKVTLKSAAARTYTKKLPTTKKTSTKKTENKSEIKTAQTTVLTDVSEKYTKKSKVKVVTTTVTTTVKTTTTFKPNSSGSGALNTSGDKTGKYTADAGKTAPLMDKRLIAAYETLGFTVEVDSSVSYAGYFNAKTRSITLRKADDTIYHELGHFLAFVTGNLDKKSEFIAVYNQEKSKYTGTNKAYATQNSSEYFAESVKDYVTNPSGLKSTRPNTYAAVASALNQVTDSQIKKIQTMYGPVWK